MDFGKYMLEIAEKTKKATSELAVLSTSDKNKILESIARNIEEQRDVIKKENEKDIREGEKSKLSAALLDRLLLNDARIDGMIESLRSVIKLSDPVGEIFDHQNLANGLSVGKQRIPLGVIGMIFESRPNVTVEAASLTIKSGNGVILRGGKEAIHSNKILGKIIQDSIDQCGFDRNMVGLIDITDREVVNHMLKAEEFIDVIIPRGGEGLINFVSKNSIIPVIKHDKGVCSLFVNQDANKEMVESIAINGKVQRPGVCNALENIYLHKNYPYKEDVLLALEKQGVKIKAYGEAHDLNPLNEKIEDINEFNVEYLDLIISVKLVDDVEEAMQMINDYGSGHSDVIVTESYTDSQKFLKGVNSAAVYVNASTRFTDGFEFGLGAEIGISTNKLHARGPVGLKELTTYKYIVLGQGQIR